MTLDGITLAALAQELRALGECKIEKIQQPLPLQIIFVLHTKVGKRRLLLSAEADDARICLTTHAKESPLKAANFLMLLRKYIGNGWITDFRQKGLDRILSLSISAKDEMGQKQQYQLILEIMGKYSNLILVGEENKVIDSIKRVPPDMSRVRQILPRIAYQPPVSSKINPLLATEDQLQQLPLMQFEGISRQMAKEIDARGRGVLPALLQNAILHPDPCLQTNEDGKPVFYSPFPFLTFGEAGRQSFDSMNETIDAFYFLREERDRFLQKQHALLKQLKGHIARVSKKLAIQKEACLSAQDAPKLRLYGELITMHIPEIRRGATQFSTLNYMDGRPISVPLDAALSPAANAQKYFKRAAKLKAGAQKGADLAQTYAQELAFLNGILLDLNFASNQSDLESAKTLLIKYGYLDAPKEKSKKAPDALADPYSFVSSQGLRILVGRNSRQNDLLTMRIASAHDYWFHAKNMPGSHVILFTNGQTPGEASIQEAAVLAATFSAGNTADKVEVDYLPRKQLWKPNGAKPGMVLFQGQKTIAVSPDRSLFQNKGQ